jgi:malonyl-CoA/methylmalonyl-CoA synthetase
MQAEFGDHARTAIIDAGGSYSYAELLEASSRVALTLLDGLGDLTEQRVAFLVPSSFDYVAIQWGIWRAGGVAVPLCTMHPANELAYVISDSDATVVVAHPEYEALLEPIAREQKRRFVLTTEALAGPIVDGADGETAAEPVRQSAVRLPNVAADRAAMLVYTSGTTSKPKGAVTTHNILAAQIRSLIEAWGWTSDDRILLVLPLHHVHGILNVLCCALWAGACCEMAPRFEADAFWKKVREGDLTLFMAVPTIYARLVKSWEAAGPDEQRAITEACGRLRLMVSGSAALPVSTLEEWRQISGHTLLERYGMTEIGMALSNPLHGERRPGHVGSPLPGVDVRLVDEHGAEVPDGTPGEIQIKGDTVFREYWRRPEATAAAFVEGWFKSGDIAIRENDIYRILGRDSVDIIKTGGFKVSALEIEEELRTHEAIDQCAVVGIEDPEWGERVSVALVLNAGATLDLTSLREWAKEHLAVYKVPSRLLVVDELPRNAMGKVVKPEVVKLFQKDAVAA